MVAYAEQLTEAQTQKPLELLTAMQQRIAPAGKYQLTNEQTITLTPNHPGRELTFQGQRDRIIFRAYLVGQQVYAIGVKTPTSNATNREIPAFLNSLRLLNDS